MVEMLFLALRPNEITSQSCVPTSSKTRKNITQTTTTTKMASLPSTKLLCACLLSRALFASHQQLTAAQRFKSALESTMSVTAQMVNSAIAVIDHKASCHHIAANGPFHFQTLVFLSSWLRSHVWFHF
jgi:hypothetical protein